MRDFKGMKRQRSRNRKPSGNQNNPNRAYESNGPEGTKARGNAQTIYEKYQQLARDANSAGDRVLAENHLQHAEHYFRMIRQMQPTRPVSEFVQRDPFSNGFDDYDDEIDGNEEPDENAVVGAEDAQPSFDEPRYDHPNRDGQNRDGRDRDQNRNNQNRDRDNRDRNNNQNRDRDNRDRDQNRNRDGNRSFEPRQNNEPRNDQPRNNEPRPIEYDENGNRRETRRERYERRRQQRFAEQEQIVTAPTGTMSGPAPFVASTEPLGAPVNGSSYSPPVESAPEPIARAPRPKREPVEDTSHLPAFLSRPAPVAASPEPAAADEAAKPKRGRPKRKAEDVAEEA